jgi:2-haloacid dehalogenase
MGNKQALSTGVTKGATQGSAQWNLEKPSLLVFDVNETLIDFESMAPLFERIFGDRAVLREWLGHLTTYSMTVTLSGLYKDFFSLGQGLLQMVGEIHRVPIKPSDVDELRTGMMTMPAHPDVAEGVRRLKEAGFRMVTLTNSPPNPKGKSPLEHAGLADFFERQFSIETARAYKPAQMVYHMVAQDLDVRPSSCCMVAAHVWDTIGAQSAGFSAALITRPGNALLPVYGLPQPNFVARDLQDLAAKLNAARQT